MKCEACGVDMKARAVTKERPYLYAMGGLPQFPLTSRVTVYECPKCRAESVTIQGPGELHRQIARALLRKPTALTGDELRFLRKHVGFSAQRFAAMLSVDPAYLSRIENGKHDQLETGRERLARILIGTAEDGAVPEEALPLPVAGADEDEEEYLRLVATVGKPSKEWNRQILPELWHAKKVRAEAQKGRREGLRTSPMDPRTGRFTPTGLRKRR